MFSFKGKVNEIMVWDDYYKSVHTGFHYLTQGNFTTEEDRHMYRLAVDYNTTGFLKVVLNPRTLKYMYIDITKEEFVEEINGNLQEI